MKIFETAATLELPDSKVWVAGDWHGNAGWVQTLLPALLRHDRTITTLFHLGDFWCDETFLGTVDYWSERTGIEIFLGPGNHEPWGELIQVEEDVAPGIAARLSEHCWFLPRPFRLKAGGRSVLALGGAASIDRRWRTLGRDWWPVEAITDQMVDAAIAGGPADIMLTHESPALSPVSIVQTLLSTNPNNLPAEALAYSAASREQIQRVWDAVKPEILLHGHLHVEGAGKAPDGRRVVALNRDLFPGNAGALDLKNMEFDLVPHEVIRGQR